MKIIFFSDTHLDKKDVRKTSMVEAFLSESCRDADMVCILGDLFEFYHGHGEYIYPWFEGIADALKGLTRSGVAVYFIEGNHEFKSGGFLESYTGAVLTEGMSIEVEGRKVFVSHGDELAGGAVRTMLKSNLAAWTMDFLGPRLTWAVAMGARVFLSKKKKVYNQKVRDRFRGYARKIIDTGYDAVILAHSHMSDLVEYNSGEKKAIYLNTGDFVKQGTYVLYESGSGFTMEKAALKQ